MNIRRTAAMAYKEWREIIRDRFFLMLAFFVPPTLMIILSYGLTTDLENIPFAIRDQDRTMLSREYARKFIDSRFFAFRGYVRHDRTFSSWIADDRVRFVLVVPPHFQRRYKAERRSVVQAIVDGTVPFRAETIGGYISATSEAFARELAQRRSPDAASANRPAAASSLTPVLLKIRYFYNEPLNSRWGIVPGVMMLMLMFVPPMLTAVSIVREKESGAIDNVYCSTLSRMEFLIGKFIPYATVSSLNALVLWFLAVVVFGVPFRGNGAAFLGVMIIFVGCTTAMGLIVSLMVRSQIAAIVVMLVVTLIPTILYSGVFNPISSLASAGKFISRLLPATYFYRIVQDSFLKGRGPAAYWSDALVLVAFLVGLLSFGGWMFRKRPDQ